MVEESQESALDADIEAARPPVLARVAAGLQGLTAIAGGLLSVQLLIFLEIVGPMRWTPYALLAGGVVTIVVAIMVNKARLWAALVGVALMLAYVAGTGAWLVFSMQGRFYSCYGFIAFAAACFGLLGAILGIWPCIKASRARTRLKAQGVETGM